jgi:putative hydrolase of the HAD superfamily
MRTELLARCIGRGDFVSLDPDEYPETSFAASRDGGRLSSVAAGRSAADERHRHSAAGRLLAPVPYGAFMQRLALFDLDNTLVQRDEAFAAWAQEFTTEHGLDGKWATWLIVADAHHEGPMDRFFAQVREEFKLSESVEQLWRQYRRRMPELASCRDEDLDALADLRSLGWRIGIVTNGTTDNQLGKIRHTGLAELVDAWCISDDVGIRKPDPRIFRLAAQRCGVPAGDGGWMVGDSLLLDIAGAFRAGLRTIWIAPPRLAAERGPRYFIGPTPDATVSSVTQAVGALKTAY